MGDVTYTTMHLTKCSHIAHIARQSYENLLLEYIYHTRIMFCKSFSSVSLNAIECLFCFFDFVSVLYDVGVDSNRAMIETASRYTVGMLLT